MLVCTSPRLQLSTRSFMYYVHLLYTRRRTYGCIPCAVYQVLCRNKNFLFYPVTFMLSSGCLKSYRRREYTIFSILSGEREERWGPCIHERSNKPEKKKTQVRPEIIIKKETWVCPGTIHNKYQKGKHKYYYFKDTYVPE